MVIARESDSWWRTLAPDIRSHDWSPDGTAVVYDTVDRKLCVANLQTGQASLVTTVPAANPVWSPEGTRIAFKIFKPLGDIATVLPDGSDLKIVIGHPSGELFSVTTPTWSPTGGHLIYQKVSFPKPVESPADADVLLTPVDGEISTNLTADLELFLVPVAWR